MNGNKLPVLPGDADELDRVEIDTPCDVPWESLPGDGRVRHCGRCRQNVYNVESLDRREASRLIADREHRVCIRIYRRPDGTVVTSDCWSRLRAARRRGVWAFVGMLFVVGWAEIAAIVVGIAGLRTVVGNATLGQPDFSIIDASVRGRARPPSPGPRVGLRAAADHLAASATTPPRWTVGAVTPDKQPAKSGKHRSHRKNPPGPGTIAMGGLIKVR